MARRNFPLAQLLRKSIQSWQRLPGCLLVGCGLSFFAPAATAATEAIQAQPPSLFEAVMILSGAPDEADRTKAEGRRIALLAGAAPELADAFAEKAAFSIGLFDSYSIAMQVAGHRACMVLVRTHDVRTMQLFTPTADAQLLLAMLVTHERKHCLQELISSDQNPPDELILQVEVEADRVALDSLKPLGEDGQHDLARQAWIRWRNMDAFLAGKFDHWTAPWIAGGKPALKDFDEAEALRKRVVRLFLDSNPTDRAANWEPLRSEGLGRSLPPWKEVQEAIERAYGTDPGALRRALRGPPIK